MIAFSLALILLFSFAPDWVHADPAALLDVVAPDAVSPDAVAPDAMVSGAAYSVSRIRYVVDGPTRVYALVAVMDIEVGQRYSSVSALESRLARSAQDLRNRRVFDEIGRASCRERVLVVV